MVVLCISGSVVARTESHETKTEPILHDSVLGENGNGEEKLPQDDKLMKTNEQKTFCNEDGSICQGINRLF